MTDDAPSARRIRLQVVGSRKLASEVSVCEPHNIAFFSRLCFWSACVLPLGLALRALYRVPMPTPQARLAHLQRRYRRRLRRRGVLAPLPPLRPSSSPGPQSGQGLQGETAVTSTDSDYVWGSGPCAQSHASGLTGLRPLGESMADGASGSTIGGAPKASATGDGSWRPSSSTSPLGGPASATSGQQASSLTVFSASAGSQAGDRGPLDPAACASASCKNRRVGRTSGTSTAPAAGRTSSMATRYGSAAGGPLGRR